VKVSILLSSVLSLVLLASCGAPAPAGPAEPVKITIFVGFGTGGDPAQVEVHRKLAEAFNAAHPGIQVSFQTVLNADHVTKFTTMLASDTVPDIVMPVGVQGVAEFFDEWIDLTPYIQADKYDTSDFYGPAKEAHTYAGRVIGLPIGVYPQVVFYNKDLFDRSGVSYPPKKFATPGWTYDALVQMAKKLTLDKKGKNAADPGFDGKSIVQYGFGGWEGGELRGVVGKFDGNMRGFSDDYKKVIMNDAGWKAALQFMADSSLVWKITPKFSSTAAVTGTFTAGDPLGTNKVALWECYSWASYLYENWNKNFTWNVAAVPAGPHGTIIAQANDDTFAISKHSKHPKEAWEVMKWLLDPPQMAQLTKSYGAIPGRKSLADGWLSEMKASNPNVDWDVFIESNNYAEKPNAESWNPAYRQVWDEMQKAMDQVTSGGAADGAAVAEALNAKVQGYTDEYWKTAGK